MMGGKIGQWVELVTFIIKGSDFHISLLIICTPNSIFDNFSRDCRRLKEECLEKLDTNYHKDLCYLRVEDSSFVGCKVEATRFRSKNSQYIIQYTGGCS